MRILYSFGIHIYGILIFIASLFYDKARELYRGQRNALKMLREKIDSQSSYVWFHAASLGEFEQGRPIIEKLKKEHPATKILLTFYSPSGYNVRKNYSCVDVVSYLPLDTRKAAQEFLKIVKPTKAIFIKYEFWPNFLLEMKAEKIPVYCISAIFRPNQIFFKKYGKWYLQLLNTFSHIFVQDNLSAKLLNEHGIQQVTVCGDTRFDRVYALSLEPKKIPLIESFARNSKVIVAGSTWPEDEELLIRYIKLHPQIKFILVPHEIDKSHLYDIFKLLEGKYIRYTEATEINIHTFNCLVVDAIGFLSFIYQYGKVAYVGGGFGAGIHNILEAAVWNVPVVFGPNYQKFREAHELIAEGGAFSISDYDSLEKKFDELLDDEEAGKKAGAYILKNVGATEKIYHLIFP